MPESVQAGFIEAAGRGDNPFLPILDWLDKQISLSICGMDLSQGSGSFASDKVKSDERMLMIAELRRKLEDIVNEQLIRRFMQYNFDPVKYPVEFYPKVRFVLQKEEDKAQYVDMITRAEATGVFFRDRLSDVNQARVILGFPELKQDEFDSMLTAVIPDGQDIEGLPSIEDIITEEPENEEQFSFYSFNRVTA